MKRIVIFSCILLMSAGIVNAQLKVASDGKVGIAVGTSTPLSTLSIGTEGDANTDISLSKGSSSFTNLYQLIMNMNYSSYPQNTYGMNIFSGLQESLNTCALSCSNLFAFGSCYGIKASAGLPTFLNLPSNLPLIGNFKAYGLYATAGNMTSGYNYGVYGLITGDANGTGIYGGVADMGSAIPGKYAGYFHGQTKVNGNFYATTVTETSDERLKTNIVPIDQEALSVLGRLNPIQYNWQQIEIDGEVNDSTNEKPKYFSPDIDFEQLHYGFLAQEVREILPNIVNEDGNGFLGINYQELIPLLVMAIQNLKEQVEYLQSGELIKRQIQKGNLSDEAVLYQNTPNPFDIATEIRYYLPVDMQDAAIYIYDMNGTQISKHTISQTGEGTLTIKGNELQAGMYLYSLIADGQVIDTKRMILTK